MKLLEQSPAKYDRGMRILTLGRIDRIKREIADHEVEPGQDVLEIGCGTGSLAALLVARGCRVVGIDIFDAMLERARVSAPGAEFLHLTATELDRLQPRRFNRIVSTLCFSELSIDEQDYVLRTAAGLLKDGGRLVLADEMVPAKRWQRALCSVVRWPMSALTFVLTQNTTHALHALEERLGLAGFHLRSRTDYLMGSLGLIVAEKT